MKPYRKAALKVTWDSLSEFEEDIDKENVCFMANENTPKVLSKILDNSDLSMDELGEGFEKLSNSYDILEKKF